MRFMRQYYKRVQSIESNGGLLDMSNLPHSTLCPASVVMKNRSGAPGGDVTNSPVPLTPLPIPYESAAPSPIPKTPQTSTPTPAANTFWLKEWSQSRVSSFPPLPTLPRSTMLQEFAPRGGPGEVTRGMFPLLDSLAFASLAINFSSSLVKSYSPSQCSRDPMFKLSHRRVSSFTCASCSVFATPPMSCSGDSTPSLSPL